MRRRVLSLLIVGGLLFASCDWQMPQSVTVKGSPEVYVPSGDTVFELDFLDDIVDDFRSDATGGTETDFDKAGEKGVDDESDYDGKPVTLFAELGFVGGDFDDASPGVEVNITGAAGPLDLTDVFGPIPDTVEIRSVPGTVTLELSSGTESLDSPIYVTLTADWEANPDAPVELLDPSPASLSDDGDQADFYLEQVFNDRPTDFTLEYELATDSGNTDDIESLVIRIEIPFAFHAAEPANLDFSEDGDDPLVMDDDIFQRDPEDPDEDLNDFLDSLRGSSATMSFDLKNSTGFGISLGMVNAVESLSDAEKKDTSNWLINTGLEASETLQTVKLDLSEEALKDMIDGTADPETGAAQFIPEFLAQLPGGDGDAGNFQINRGGEFSIDEGYLRVKSDIDHTFSLEDEE